MCTTWRIVSSVSVRRESGCVLAPHVVTQCVPADASAGTSAAAARAAAAYFKTLIEFSPYGVVVDSVKTSVRA